MCRAVHMAGLRACSLLALRLIGTSRQPVRSAHDLIELSSLNSNPSRAYTDVNTTPHPSWVSSFGSSSVPGCPPGRHLTRCGTQRGFLGRYSSHLAFSFVVHAHVEGRPLSPFLFLIRLPRVAVRLPFSTRRTRLRDPGSWHSDDYVIRARLCSARFWLDAVYLTPNAENTICLLYTSPSPRD